MALPGLARLFLSSIQLQRRMTYRYQVIVEETLRAIIPAEQRDAVTAEMYARTSWYLPNGRFHRLGLFPLERELIRSEQFPRSGRILLGAAGGGRELAPLCELGYDVVAFEPSDLVTAAEAYAATQPRATVVRASYADLVRAVHHHDGSLARLVEQPFDAIILGWGSISHVLDENDRLELFRALRVVGPAAPVITSYIGSRDASVRLRRLVRRVALRLGRERPPEGVMLRADSGFTYVFAPGELELLALRAGYRATLHEGAADQYALFIPRVSG